MNTLEGLPAFGLWTLGSARFAAVLLVDGGPIGGALGGGGGDTLACGAAADTADTSGALGGGALGAAKSR